MVAHSLRVFALLTVLSAVSGAFASDVFFEAHSLDEALRLAKGNDTYIVVDFWHKACGPCRRFAKAVKDNERVIGALKDLVLFKVEMPANETLGREYNVYLFPTYAVLNADGEMIQTWIGYYGPEDWAAELGAVLADPVTPDQRRARFEQNPSYTDALSLGKAAYAQKRLGEANDYLHRAMTMDPQAAKEANVPILLFRTAFTGAGMGQVTAEQCGTVIEEVLGAEDVKDEDVLEIGSRLFGAVDEAGLEALEPHLRKVRSVLPETVETSLNMKRLEFLAEYAFYIENQPEEAVRLKRQSMPPMWELDCRRLNRFAWWCFQRKTNLDEAQTLARRAVELSPDSGQKANCLDTLAEIVNLSGDTDEAIALMKRALELDLDGPYSDYYKRQLAKFEKMRDSAGTM